jgi:hypothetical protein
VKSMRKLIIAAVAALVAVAFSAAGAQACPYSGAEQVFSPWGDSSFYVLAPDGGFEAGGSGWSLNGGAVPVEGNEPFHLNDAADAKSLELPAGSSAVSPSICMSIDTPHFRLLARNTGDPTSTLRVEATYVLLGLLRTKTVGTVKAGPNWEPSQQLSTVLTLSTVVGTLTPSAIQIRITPVGSGGNWQVDDVYVDPFARR